VRSSEKLKDKEREKETNRLMKVKRNNFPATMTAIHNVTLMKEIHFKGLILWSSGM
jgi:hypothetical protein